MRPKTCLTILAPLLKKKSFTSREAKIIGVSSALLNYYVKIGKLKKIRHGVYQSIGYKNNLSFRWEDLIEAVHSIHGGVVCLVSALAVYDLTEEIPRQHWIGIRHGTSIKCDRQIKLIRFRNFDLGKTEIDLEGVKIFIFDRERTIVDAFRLLSMEIAIKALKLAVAKSGKDRIDLLKIESYAKKLKIDISSYIMSATI